MAIIISASGTYTVIPGETYIIDPNMEGEVKFVANPHDPAPVDFKIELNESPAHDHDVKIKVGSDNALSPEVVIADGYVGEKTEFDFKDAFDTDFTVGTGVYVDRYELSEDGKDTFQVGPLDRDILLATGESYFEIDGNGPHDDPSPSDTLLFDTSWLTPEEIHRLEAELIAEGFESDGAGNWTAVDANNDGKLDEDRHVEFEIDLDGDGHLDFKIKLPHWENIALGDFSATGPDFIVEGTSGADVIDAAYDGDPEGDLIDAGDNATGGDEDLVDAGSGDDTVLSGAADDTVYAGSGDDSVSGGGGDDVIYGDSALGEADSDDTVRESFEWDLAPDLNGGGLVNGDPVGNFTQNTGSVDVQFAIGPASAGVQHEFESTLQNVAGIDGGSETVDPNSSFYSETGGSARSATYTLDFNAPGTTDATEVENVQFRVNDIDGDGVVRVTAFDAAGNPVDIELTAGSNLTLTAPDTADSNGGYMNDDAPQYSLLVEIAGPVHSIVVEHSQNGTNNSGVQITDVYFDAPVVTGPEGPGDDTLEGGEGDDLIYGQTGDDKITGGTGNDTLFGDDPADGAPIGPNLIVNGSFEDTSGMATTGYGFVGAGAIPGWTDANGEAIDVHNDGRGGVDPTDGNNWLDLEASPGNNLVGQDVAGVQDGTSYLLTFDAGDAGGMPQSGPDQNLVNVYWGGELIATIDPNGATMDTYQFVVEGGAGNGSNRLEFEGTGPENNIGASIDSVSLVQLSGSTGAAGNDTIEGGDGADLIAGQDGSDDLSGGDGDDTIIGGSGDEIVGGEGSDSIVIDASELDENGENDGPISIDASTEGSDQDTLDLTGFDAYRNLVETPDADGDSTSGSLEVRNAEGEWVSVTFTEVETLLLPPKAPDGVVDGEETGETMGPGYNDANGPTDGGGDIIDGPDGLDDSIRGNGGDDSINAGLGDDTVDGGEGDDTVNGNQGDDLLDGGAGDDLVTGGLGDDTVLGGAGHDELRGNEGDDSLDGGEGDDSMGGAEGDDTLQGGAGNDTLSGGSGDDVLDGGADDDTINGNSGNDLITDLEGDNLVTSGIDGLPDRGFPFVGNADPNPNDDRDTVTTGDGDDTIRTGDDDDVINAGNGDNVIDSGFDDDSVTSGDGADEITSGEGSDTINSGGGDDTIFGGLGPVLGSSANLIDENVDPSRNDPILDNGDDLIDAGAGDDLVFGEDDNDTILGGAGDDTLDGGIDDDVIEGGAGDDSIIGGQGADSLSGGAGDDTFTVGLFTDPIFGDTYVEGAGDTIVGGEDPGDGDTDVLDLSGAGPLKIVFDDAVDPTGTPGKSGTVTFFTDNTQSTVAGTLTFSEIENVIPCFTPGSLIATPRGEVPVETLREGDKVITRDNGIQEIRWTGSRTLGRAEFARAPNLKPILVRAGALGHGLPERDMLVSPQHRMLVSGTRTQLYFDESEVLVAAKHLVNHGSIQAVDTLRTTYIHFMFDRHEVVLSDGAWTESFQPGDQTLGAMGQETRDEIVELFPELATAEGLTDYTAARRSLKAHEAKLLQL